MKIIDTKDIPNWPEQTVLAELEIVSGRQSSFLTLNEKAEFDSFKNQKRRNEFLAARKIYHTLKGSLDFISDDCVLIKEQQGKPILKSGQGDLSISFAHTNQSAFCCISRDHQIGVDAEMYDRDLSSELANRMLNNKESWAKENLSLIEIWTIKEAVLKCKGTGLRTNLINLTISGSTKNNIKVLFNDDKSFEICSFRQSNHQIALAYQSKGL